MNSTFEVIVFIIQIVATCILLYILYFLLKERRSTVLDKRFSPYTIDTLDEENDTFLDSLKELYKNICNGISKILIRIKIFDSYSDEYEKYDPGISKIEKMNYISNKFLIGLLCLILLLVSALLKNTSISLLLGLFVFLIGFFSLDIYLIIDKKLKKRKIEKDMNKAIMLMNNAFKSGCSIMQAIYLVYTELDGPISKEFKKMYMDITFGLSMEVVFNRFAKRVDCVEANYMATSLSVVNKTGGNIVQVFNSVERNSLNRQKLKDELESVSASARATFKILVCIPPILVLLMLFLNPSYFSPLFTSVLGWLCLIASVLLYVLYIIIIRKIVYMEVKL